MPSRAPAFSRLLYCYKTGSYFNDVAILSGVYNGFMLTAPEIYGIVTAAGKNLLPLKKSWLERPGK